MKLTRARKAPLGLLPAPPDDAEMFSYIKRHLWLVNSFSVVSFAAVAYSTTRFSFAAAPLLVFVGLLFLALISLVSSVQATIGSRDFDPEAHRRLVDGWPTDRYPSVDVFLPICGEYSAVLLNTWRHVKALDYPNLEVYVLDDSKDDRMRAPAERHGFRYLRRPNPGWFKKAGNLRFGYGQSSGEFIVVLDADFCPRPDFLRQTLPYMAADPKLGILQTPQYFATHNGQGWIERGAGAVQELFYRVSQVARDHCNAAICVGSNAVYRRAALDSNGGTTLIEHSEDVHTGFDLRRKGWPLRYIPVNLATGVCPDNLSGFFRQQYRWCMGSMSLVLSRRFWSTTMPVRSRLCYVSGFAYYIVTGLLVLSGPALPLTLTLAFPARIRLLNYVVLIPTLLWGFVLSRVWHRSSYRQEVLSVKLAFGWAHVFAIIDVLRRKPMGWTPTGAKSNDRRVFWFRFWAAAWGAGSASVLVGSCLWRVLADHYSPVQYAAMTILAVALLQTNLRIALDGFSAARALDSLRPRSRPGRVDEALLTSAALPAAAAAALPAIAISPLRRLAPV